MVLRTLLLLLFDRRNFSKPSSHFLPDPNICPNRLNTDLGTSSLSGRVSLPILSHKRCFLTHRTHNFPLRRTFASVFPFPSIGDISGPRPDQKERDKTSNTFQHDAHIFVKKACAPTKTKRHPKASPNGDQNHSWRSPGEPKVTQSSPEAPTTLPGDPLGIHMGPFWIIFRFILDH